MAIVLLCILLILGFGLILRFLTSDIIFFVNVVAFLYFFFDIIERFCYFKTCQTLFMTVVSVGACTYEFSL